jgi:hypothetical protein
VEYALTWISPNRWLVEDLFMCHAGQLSAVYRLPPTWYYNGPDSLLGFLIGLSYTEKFEVSKGAPNGQERHLEWNVLMNFWFGVMTRFLAFLSLNYSNRNQMVKPPLVEAFLGSLNGFLQVCFPNADLGGNARKVQRKAEGRYAAVQYFFGLDNGKDNSDNDNGGGFARGIAKRMSIFRDSPGGGGGGRKGGVVSQPSGGGGGEDGGDGAIKKDGAAKKANKKKKTARFSSAGASDEPSVLCETTDLGSLRARGLTIQPDFADTYMGAAEEGRSSTSEAMTMGNTNPMAAAHMGGAAANTTPVEKDYGTDV